MKQIIVLLTIAALTGCISAHERTIAKKETLCVQFGMEYQEFQFDNMTETDVICKDRETGQQVYMMLVPNQR